MNPVDCGHEWESIPAPAVRMSAEACAKCGCVQYTYAHVEPSKPNPCPETGERCRNFACLRISDCHKRVAALEIGRWVQAIEGPFIDASAAIDYLLQRLAKSERT